MVVEVDGPKAGMWFDHATGQGGDVIDLWAITRGWDSRHDFPRILDELASWLGEISPTVQSKPDRKPPPVDELGPYTGKWDYHDRDGNLVACVYRYDPHSGKEFRPWDVSARRWQAPDPRPLYNLPKVMASKKVVLVEGEKCAQALIDAGIVATTAMHGAKAPVEKTDWSPLAGKEVLIWPDKDTPGWSHAEAMARACQNVGCRSVAILLPPDEKASKVGCRRRGG
jgi:DNA primase